MTWLVTLPAQAAEPLETGQIIAVDDGGELRLKDNRKVRLANIQVVDKICEWPFSEMVKMDVLDTDRYGRMVAQLYTPTEQWVQAELLRNGQALADVPPPDKQGQLPALLAAEKEARDARRGYWAEGYSPVEATKWIGQFRVVEGKVLHVAERGGHVYLDFGEKWNEDFTCYISKKQAKQFKAIDLPGLKGKTVRVRGWIYAHGGPTIDLQWPGQLQVVE